MKQNFCKAKGRKRLIEVPDHILDTIPVRTAAYIDTRFNKAIAAANGMSEDEFRRASTHNIVNTPERRQLHREILQEVMERGLKGERPEKPVFIYFVGPMAVGKTTLRKHFDERIEKEETGAAVAPYSNEALEGVYRKYKQASSYQIDSDFSIYKERLPEFERFGNNFGVIRAEASALDKAVTDLAGELNACLILEQLGSGGMDIEWIKQKAEEYEWVAIGVTADPVVNANGMHARCKSIGQDITDEELASTIKGFSGSDAFRMTTRFTNQAVLLQSDQGYEVVCKWQSGVAHIQNNIAYDTFQSYADMSEEDLVSTFRLEKIVKPPEIQKPQALG